VRAGRAAELAAAPAEALEHYQRALELWDQAPGAAANSPLDRVAVLHRAAEAADFAGRSDLAVTLATQALGQIDAAAEPLRAGVLLERLCYYHWLASDRSAAIAAIERAVATVPAEPPTWERRACWPLMAASSCWWDARRRRWPAARRRSPWPGTWARRPRRLTP